MGTTVDKEVLTHIVDIEWEMFRSVQSMDGPAACQQDRGTFEIMRSSQILSWDQATAESYLRDLTRAKDAGRNLMTEKYARMMEYTAPCEFRRIAAELPPLDQKALPLIERLSALSVSWMEELVERFPHVGAQGRPIHAWDDSRYATSFETYNRGELSTYSAETLQLLYDHYVEMASGGENPAEVILRHTVERYGFASLEQAEAAAKTRAEKSGPTDGHD